MYDVNFSVYTCLYCYPYFYYISFSLTVKLITALDQEVIIDNLVQVSFLEPQLTISILGLFARLVSSVFKLWWRCETMLSK